jgi:EpsI family protein
VVGMLIGAAWALLGNRAFRVLAFPFFYLYFAVPEGEFLVPYLQDWTAMVVVKLLHLTGIPVFLEGRYLTIPSGSFVVAEACSGVNYLIATLSVGAMFMYMQFRATWRRLLFMLAAVVVPLLANGVRAYGIVMISHLSNYRYAQGVDHFIYGWVFFGFVIFLLFWIGNLFSDINDAAPSAVDMSPGVGVSKVNLMCTALLAIGIVLVPRGALRALDSTRPLAAEVGLPVVPGWQGPETIDSALRPNFRGADQTLAARYTAADGRNVTLDIIYFRKQGSGGELVNHDNHVFDAERQRQVDYGKRTLRAGGVVSDVEVLRLRDLLTGGETLYWYWYDSHGKRSANRPSIKLAEGLARMAGRNEGGALMVLGTPVGEGASAVEVLDAFLATGALKLELLHPAH